MTFGPIYFDGTNGPMQTVGASQVPVIIRGADFEFWCCLDTCLIDSYQEHRKALGQGEDTSACITSAMLITWLETYYSSFIDHDRAGAPLSADNQSFEYFTLARWYTVAGIDGTWKQGDLANAFNALQWTLSEEQASVTLSWCDNYSNYGTGHIWSTATADAESKVTCGSTAMAKPAVAQYTQGYWSASGLPPPDDNDYETLISAQQIDALYAKDLSGGAVAYSAYLYGYIRGYEFFDSYSTSYTENEWNYIGVDGATVGTNSLPSPWCSAPDLYNDSISMGWRLVSSDRRFVMKWNFTTC